MSVVPEDQNKNRAVREPTRKRIALPEDGAAPKKKTARVNNTQSAAAQMRIDLPIYPAGSLKDNLLYNKTASKGRLIFRQSVIGPRGTRQYQYEAEDSGQCFWSYRPLGFWL